MGGGGFCKAKTFKEMCEAKLEFPEGWGEVWIFSGILILDLKLAMYMYMCRNIHIEVVCSFNNSFKEINEQA